MADENVRRSLAIAMGMNRPTYFLWPVPTGVPAAGIVMVPGAGAWGAQVDVIAAAAIATEFWVMRAVFTLSAGAHGLREVQITNLTGAQIIYECRVDTTAATVNLPPFNLPIPAWCAAGDQIQGRAGAAAAADKLSVSLLVATGM